MMFRRILVGLDGSEGGRHALEMAADLATLCKAELLVVSIEEKLPAYAATVGEVEDEERHEHRYFRQIQHEARRLIEPRGIPLHMEVVPGHPALALARLASERDCDLIVLGHTGHSRLHHLFLGSTADRVVERAHCAVLVVR
ncbi:MAG TPA: universal stress protein [Gemmatimonadales bacterium]|jgi:nucleotide-binding universal stress UspA family protein